MSSDYNCLMNQEKGCDDGGRGSGGGQAKREEEHVTFSDLGEEPKHWNIS